jgi:hypothetical protein
LIVLAVLMISGRGTISSAIIGTILLTVPSGYITGTHVADIEQLIFGVAAIGAALLVRGPGVRALGRYGADFAQRLRGPAGARLADRSNQTISTEAVG